MGDKLYSRVYKIVARNEEQLNVLEMLFEHIQYLGKVGSSRSIELFVDGDGAVQLKFYKKRLDDVYIKLLPEKVEELDMGYGDVRVDADGDKYYFDLG